MLRAMVQIPNKRSFKIVAFIVTHEIANDHPDESRIPTNPAYHSVKSRDTVGNRVDVSPLLECQAEVLRGVLQVFWPRGLWLIRLILCGEADAFH